MDTNIKCLETFNDYGHFLHFGFENHLNLDDFWLEYIDDEEDGESFAVIAKENRYATPFIAICFSTGEKVERSDDGRSSEYSGVKELYLLEWEEYGQRFSSFLDTVKEKMKENGTEWACVLDFRTDAAMLINNDGEIFGICKIKQNG